MPEQLLYEYAVLRLVPRVEREEFLNLGVIFYCKQTGFLKCKYQINDGRIAAIYDGVDIGELKKNLESFCKIAAGDEDGGPIAKLDKPTRFRWLTAIRSTMIQTSKVHPGFADNEEQKLKELFNKLVVD